MVTCELPRSATVEQYILPTTEPFPPPDIEMEPPICSPANQFEEAVEADRTPTIGGCPCWAATRRLSQKARSVRNCINGDRDPVTHLTRWDRAWLRVPTPLSG